MNSNTESSCQEVKRTVISSETVNPKCTLVAGLLVARVALSMPRSCLVAGVITVPKIPLEELQLIGDVYHVLVDSLQYTHMSVGRDMPADWRSRRVSSNIP